MCAVAAFKDETRPNACPKYLREARMAPVNNKETSLTHRSLDQEIPASHQILLLRKEAHEQASANSGSCMCHMT
jgi:hypothetical protein